MLLFGEFIKSLKMTQKFRRIKSFTLSGIKREYRKNCISSFESSLMLLKFNQKGCDIIDILVEGFYGNKSNVEH